MAKKDVESRSACALRRFNGELRAYQVLRSLQGTGIPKFLGHFYVKFLDRELQVTGPMFGHKSFRQ